MDLDDPEVPEFCSHDSYRVFAQRVLRERRYATDARSKAFIATVLATAPTRDFTIPAGQIFYRAQLGIDEQEWVDDKGGGHIETLGLGRERMTPKPEYVQSGRTNPPGIAHLYLGSSALVAVSEVRPWIGARVSVAQFEVRRELRALDLFRGHGDVGVLQLTFGQLLGKTPVNAETKRRVVWTDIDNAFSRPVSRQDESIDYVPTQILAEAFREQGYQAVVYRSNFDDPGYNVTLFDVSDAEILNCAPYKVRNLAIDFKQCGNTWFTTAHGEDAAHPDLNARVPE